MLRENRLLLSLLAALCVIVLGIYLLLDALGQQIDDSIAEQETRSSQELTLTSDAGRQEAVDNFWATQTAKAPTPTPTPTAAP